MNLRKIPTRVKILLAGVVLVLFGLASGAVWGVFWIADNINAPGPGATGSGPCGPADSVNIQMMVADGHTVQACTHDRPSCPNSSMSQFGFGNQLRSSSRRYIIFLRFDAALPAEAAEQTLPIDPRVFPLVAPAGGSAGNGTLSAAMLGITPRDPYEDEFKASSGSITVSSSRGVAHGRIDGKFNVGPFRSDRPAPSPATMSPVLVTGVFACSR